MVRVFMRRNESFSLLYFDNPFLISRLPPRPELSVAGV